MGKIEGLTDEGVHSKNIPAFALPDRCHPVLLEPVVILTFC